jgi:hypothetical protein
MTLKVTNNASGVLQSSINAVATTVQLQSGQGALFPTLSAGQYFYVTLVNSTNDREIVKVTARATDTLTVVRGQDETTAISFTAGDKVELRVVAAFFQAFAQVSGPNTFVGTQTLGGLAVTGNADVDGNLEVGGGATFAALPTVSSRKFDAFPAGTALLFNQTSAPTGWTKSTTHNDKALRVVSGAAGSGGTTAFSSVFAARTILTANLPAHTHTVSGTTGAAGSHNHTVTDQYVANGGEGTYGGGGINDSPSTTTQTTSTAPTHTHTFSGTTSSVGSDTAMDFAVQYVDVIIATKDA